METWSRTEMQNSETWDGNNRLTNTRSTFFQDAENLEGVI